jgi:hypothetical protein
MQRLFHSLERFGVRHLLISGQASILYGAASFSEDVDLWLAPDIANVARFLQSIAALHSTVYKLTPAMTRRNVNLGHGFHFLVPDGDVPIYLDVMPRPPRVGTFAAGFRRRRTMATPMGRLDVVSIEDLVELKKTRRLADYDVITNLVAIRLREERAPSRALLAWAARNTFRAADRASYLRLLGRRRTEAACQRELLRDLSRLQKSDTRYWTKITDDPRRLRRSEALVPVGTPASELDAR